MTLTRASRLLNPILTQSPYRNRATSPTPSPDLVQQQRGDRRRSGGMDLAAAQVEAGEVGVMRETRAQLACAVVADARIRLGEVRGLRWQGRLDDRHGSGGVS